MIPDTWHLLGRQTKVGNNSKWNYVRKPFERLKTGGAKLLVGDLVQPDENDNKTVVVVNEENKNKFTIWDIVMTLPGYDVEYSGMVYSRAQWYESVMIPHIMHVMKRPTKNH